MLGGETKKKVYVLCAAAYLRRLPQLPRQLFDFGLERFRTLGEQRQEREEEEKEEK